MRTLLCVFIALALLLALNATRADTVVSASPLTLVRLTMDATVQRNPSIAWSQDGDVTVAWEQNFSKNGALSQGVFARVQQSGVWSPAVNISSDSASAHEPSVFGVGQYSAVVFQDATRGPSYIARSDWSGTAWSAPQTVAGGDYAMSLNPIGVQASDGSVWLARWVRTVGNQSDIIVQQLGGPAFNVSNDGRGWRNPALVAGNNGKVYVGWIDHTKIPVGAAPGMRVAQVTTGGVVALPQPSRDYYCYWPVLAYGGGQLTAIWYASSLGLVRESVWNGSSWNRQVNLAKANTPSAVAGQNLYVTWESQGRIYLKENSLAPRAISGNLTTASQPVVAEDNSGNALVAFIASGDVWFVQVPGQ